MIEIDTETYPPRKMTIEKEYRKNLLSLNEKYVPKLGEYLYRNQGFLEVNKEELPQDLFIPTEQHAQTYAYIKLNKGRIINQSISVELPYRKGMTDNWIKGRNPSGNPIHHEVYQNHQIGETWNKQKEIHLNSVAGKIAMGYIMKTRNAASGMRIEYHRKKRTPLNLLQAIELVTPQGEPIERPPINQEGEQQCTLCLKHIHQKRYREEIIEYTQEVIKNSKQRIEEMRTSLEDSIYEIEDLKQELKHLQNKTAEEIWEEKE